MLLYCLRSNIKLRIHALGLIPDFLHPGFLLLLLPVLRFLLLVLLLSVPLNTALVLVRALLILMVLAKHITMTVLSLAIFPFKCVMVLVQLIRLNQARVILALVMRDIQKKTGSAGPQTHAPKVNTKRAARAFLINVARMKFA